MNTYDWSRFVTRVNIKAPINNLYNAWATRAGIESWFLRMSEYKKPDGTIRSPTEQVAVGDTYRWRWYGWGDDVTEQGTILACNEIDHFKFSFGDAGNCTITIKEESGETIVELLQTEIPTTDIGMHQWHLGCKTGWTFFLANLKSIMEGGIDLRNKNEALKQMVNA